MNPLIASILNNPSKHQVNRAEKMDATIDKMVDNLLKSETQDKGAVINSGNRGYGQGRNSGD